MEAFVSVKVQEQFSLKSNDRYYVAEKGMDTVRAHAREFVQNRLASAYPRNDGK